MIRNLKVLGLSLAALFATNALGASLASAQTTIWFEGEEGIQTVTAAQDPNTDDVIGVTEGGRVIQCKQAHYSGDTSTVDMTESEFELTPTFDECLAESFVAPMRMNGCDFRFYNLTTNAEGKRTASVEITCPIGNQIETELSLFGTFKCLVTFGPQTPGGHVVFTNTGSGSERKVTASVTLEKMHYTEHGKSPSGKTASGFAHCDTEEEFATGDDGGFEGRIVISGRTHSGIQKGVWIDS